LGPGFGSWPGLRSVPHLFCPMLPSGTPSEYSPRPGQTRTSRCGKYEHEVMAPGERKWHTLHLRDQLNIWTGTRPASGYLGRFRVQLRRFCRLDRTAFEQGHNGRRASVCIWMSPRHSLLIQAPPMSLSYEDLEIGIPRCVNPENGSSKMWVAMAVGEHKDWSVLPTGVKSKH
jgi:hypothetical protein